MREVFFIFYQVLLPCSMISINNIVGLFKCGKVFNMRCVNHFCSRINEPNKMKKNYVFNIEKEQRDFQNSLSTTLDSLRQNSIYKELPDVEIWLQKVMKENLIGGKQRRGFSAVMAYGMTEDPEKVTEQSLVLARTLGWCVEMFQTYVVILDDIMDGSVTRRGKTCWYRRPEVGLSCAINDSVLVYNNMLHLLKVNFKNTVHYQDMFNLITEIMCLSSGGQYLDYIAAKSPKVYSKFTMDLYDAIVIYKTAYYTYNLPVNLGLLFTSNFEKEMFKPVNAICTKLGRLFQMQDDYIDCYGDEAMTGKVGTDIQEGKCSWLAVQALQHCTDRQRNVFHACYGSPEPAHIERIKRLYDELKLPQIYREEESSLHKEISEQIRSIPRDSIRHLLKTLLEITYKRIF